MENINPRTDSPSTGLRVDVIDQPGTQEQMLRLLNQSFGVSNGQFFDDFPVWSDRHHAPVLRIGAFDGSEMVACAAGRLTQVKLGREFIPTMIIGCVATTEAYRGKGLATELALYLLEWGESRGIALTVLWGSEHELYRKLGFELCGTQVQCEPVPKRAAVSSETVVISEGWNDEIFELAQKRKTGLILEEADLSWYRAHKNTQWFRTQDQAGRVSSYLGYQRGIDLQGLIHEYGGDPTALKTLLGQFVQKFPEAQMISSHDELLADSRVVKTDYLCMARLTDVRSDWLRCFKAVNPEVPAVLTEKDGMFTVDIAGHRSPPLNELNVTKLLFGPEKLPNFVEQFLPIPIWFWGLDAC